MRTHYRNLVPSLLVVAITVALGCAAQEHDVDTSEATATGQELDTVAWLTSTISPMQQASVDKAVDSMSYDTLVWVTTYSSRRLGSHTTAFDNKSIARDIASAFASETTDTRARIHAVVLFAMTGDVAGAASDLAGLQNAGNQEVRRQIVKQLNRVREAKAKILRAMARKRPPRAHGNTNDPTGAARDQNKQASYTQWIAISTQLMSEVQQTERELMDLLGAARRSIDELWALYASLRETQARTAASIGRWN